MPTKSLRLMINVAWIADCNIGADAIDADHRRLYQMLEHVREAYVTGQEERCLALIKNLTAAILAHFAHEEAVFAKLRYPAAKRHVAQHALLAQRVQAISEGAKRSPTARSALADLIDGLAAVMMTDHLTLDLELRSFLS